MRKIWNFLSITTIGIAVWFAVTAISQLYNYQAMSAKAAVQILSWNTESLASGYYTTQASFSFAPQKNAEDSSGALLSQTIVTKARKGLFMSEFAAQKYIEEQQSQEVCCFYSPQKPHICALEHKFPLKASIHMLITTVIALYFLFVRKYISKVSEEMQ